jgi:sugar phosphate isomerase/epimerase
VTQELSEAVAGRIALLHLCDAAPPPVGASNEAELRSESRTARRLPGEGVLPLRELLAALPADLPLSLEAPSRRLEGLSANDRARIALEATQAWLRSAA